MAKMYKHKYLSSTKGCISELRVTFVSTYQIYGQQKGRQFIFAQFQPIMAGRCGNGCRRQTVTSLHELKKELQPEPGTGLPILL